MPDPLAMIGKLYVDLQSKQDDLDKAIAIVHSLASRELSLDRVMVFPGGFTILPEAPDAIPEVDVSKENLHAVED